MPYASTADYNVQIVDNSGVPIVTFGGGTQYADGTAAATPTGTQVNFNEGGTQRSVSLTKPLPVQGVLGNNAAAPGTTNIGALGALANAAAPSWTEGRQVFLSSDLAGNLRVIGSGTFTVAGGKTNNSAAPGATNVGTLGMLANATAPSWTEGNQVVGSVDLAGNLRVLSTGALTNNGAAPSTTNFGSLIALANAADPTWTEGRQVLISATLAGYQRVAVKGNTAAGSAAPDPVGIGFLGTGSTLRHLTGANQLTATPGNDVVGVGPLVYSTTGPTWDRIRDANSVAGQAGTGLLGAGEMVYDGTNWRRRTSDTSGNAIVTGAAAAGSAIAGNPVLAGGSDGTNARALLTDTSGRQIVVGAAVAGAAVAGNPLLLGVSDGTNIQTMKQATTSIGGIVSTGIPLVVMASVRSGNAIQPVPSAGGDGQSSFAVPVSASYLFNGTTHDQARNNIDASLLTSGARTTTQTSADITTYNCTGITLTLDMTVVGTGSVTVTINGKDLNSAKYYNLLTGAAVITNSTNVYRIQPGLTAAATADVNARLPRIIQVVITANNANSATYSCSYCLHN